MNLKLTEVERDALRAVLVHRSRTIRREGAGFVATHMADDYARIADALGELPVRKDTVSVRLTQADSSRIEHLVAHDCSPALRPILFKIHEARRPKADPRRPNGRKARQEVA